MENYNQTDKSLHFLSQLLAKAGRTYVPAKDDDSHTNIYFDPVGNRLTGRWIETPNGHVLLGLHLDTQNFEIVDTSFRVLGTVSTVSKQRSDVEKEVEALLSKQGLDPDGFSTELHFEIPTYDFADQPIGKLDAEGLQMWKDHRRLANETCFTLLGHAQTSTEIRIWPHHFDTGVYFKPKNDLGVGFGLAMRDDMAGAPYYYMSAYPEGREIKYENLPEGLWQWEVGENWKGAMLTLEKLEKLYLKNEDVLDDFLKIVYQWFLKQ